MALSGHRLAHRTCPLLGVKRTSGGHAVMSAFDPKRTLSGRAKSLAIRMGRVATSELSHAQCVSIRKVLSSNSTSDVIGAAFWDVTRVIRDAGGPSHPTARPVETLCRQSRNVPLLAQSGHSDPLLGKAAIGKPTNSAF